MTRIVGILLLAPPAGFLIEAVRGSGGFEFLAGAWGNTLVVAGGAAILGLVLGIPTGIVLAHTRRRAPLALTILPLLVPPALGAAGWMGLRFPAPGPLGCGVILGALLWPIVALPLYASLTRLPASSLESALVHLSTARMLRRVVWPSVRPALVTGALLVFLLAASDFTVPSTFAVPTVSYVVFERLSALRFASAAWAALPLMLITAALAFLVRRVPILPALGRSRPFLRGSCLYLFGAVSALGWSATAILPAAIWMVTVRTPAAFARLVSVNSGAILWSAWIAGATAVLLVAWASVNPRRSKLEPLWLAALILPGIAGAVGVLSLANRLGIQPYLSPGGLLLIFALMARFAYAAWLPLREPAPRGELEAAELAGLSRVRTWMKIVWPALRPRALATGAIVFALCLGEVGPPLLLDPPGRQTVVQHLFNWMHFGYDETVAALSLVLLALAALMAWGGLYVGRVDRAPVAG